MEKIRIGVVPGGERDRRRRLFESLEKLLEVRFVSGCDDVAACVSFDAESTPEAVRTLTFSGDETAAEGAGAMVEIAPSGTDPRLRGRRFEDRWVGDAHLPSPTGEVLASNGGRALWSRTGSAEAAALGPLELGPEEPLRDRLHPGRWLALLPLLQFARSVGAPAAWAPPPPSAVFLLDDPNLHWKSYGFLDFAEAAAAAREHRYHLALAMVPIDAWFAHPAAARIFRENPEQLSLLMHGNDHLARELARPFDEDERLALLGQALRRISRFERRSGVPVARVMAAPHGVCSEEMARAMHALEFEAVTISRPYPWLARPPAHWLARPPACGPTVAMRPTEPVTGGLPVLLRTTLDHGEDDLVFRAFLDQPLIVSGHHDDLSTGLGRLAELAGSINRIDGVRWGSLTEIARSSFSTRLEQGVLRIRPHARRLSVALPEDAGAVLVEPAAAGDRLLLDGAPVAFEEPIAVEAGRVELELVGRARVDPGTTPSRHSRPWAVARRIAAEGRDRIQPLRGAR
jgi:hypothetical protein